MGGMSETAPDTSAPHAVPDHAVQILCQLGRVKSPNLAVSIDSKEADRNSNRWIFDVEHDTRKCRSYEVELVDFLTGKVKAGALMSTKIMPLNEEAARADIWMSDPDGFTVDVGEGAKGVIRYRVTIDATIYTTGKRQR